MPNIDLEQVSVNLKMRREAKANAIAIEIKDENGKTVTKTVGSGHFRRYNYPPDKKSQPLDPGKSLSI